jgi:hypothetical protein
LGSCSRWTRGGREELPGTCQTGPVSGGAVAVTVLDWYIPESLVRKGGRFEVADEMYSCVGKQ